MKKIIFAVMAVAFLGVTFLLTACSSNMENRVKENLSEGCQVLFAGENHNFKATLECGIREEIYAFNGKSEPKKDFGVIKVVFKAKYNDSKAGFILMNNNGDNLIGELEENPFDGSFMADVEKLIGEDAEIGLDVNGEVVTLVCKSKDFVIDYDKAIEIATIEMEDKLSAYSTSTAFSAECYLKIIDNQKNGFDDYFWYFSIYGADNKTHACVISVETGEVLSNR